MKNTIVISAYPACGKSYFFEHMQDKYSVLDSDSSKFSWKMRKRTQEELEEERKNWEAVPRLLSTDMFMNNIKNVEIKARNEDFPNNYIEHIKENLGKVDIIFVSSHLSVRQAMSDAGIPFFTVYPESTLLNEWVGRMYRRGNDKSFIDFQIENWSMFQWNVDYEPHGLRLFRLKSNEYIDCDIIRYINKYYQKYIEDKINQLELK